MIKQHSLEEKTLPELKQLAQEFDLTPDQIAEHGDRRRRSTWLEAIRAAQQTGKTTREYRELLITRKIAQLAKGEEPEQPEPKLWCDNLVFLGQLEHFFFQQRRADLIVPTGLLSSMHLEDERFSQWADWMVPGNLFTTYRQTRTYQILAIDRASNIFYLPIDKPQLMRTHLMAVRHFTYPTPLPESGGIVDAADYIKIMHEATDEPDYTYMEIRV